MRDLVAAFIIGSSLPAFASFFMGFNSLNESSINPNNCFGSDDMYYGYTIVAPLYIGSMSAIAAYINNKYDLSVRESFAIISVISVLLVSIMITLCDVYDFSDRRLWVQYFYLLLFHSFTYVVVVATLYMYIMDK